MMTIRRPYLVVARIGVVAGEPSVCLYRMAREQPELSAVTMLPVEENETVKLLLKDQG